MLSLRKGKETSRVNEPVLILEGKQAVSWLADQSYITGLDAPASYPQSETGSFVKLDARTCIVCGAELAERIENEWRSAVPDDIILHRLDTAQKKTISSIARHYS